MSVCTVNVCKDICYRLLNAHAHTLCVTNFKFVNVIFLTECSLAQSKNKTFSSAVSDSIDVFAEKLVQDKVKKWQYYKLQRNIQMPLCRNTNLNCGTQDHLCMSDEMLNVDSLVNSDQETCKRFILTALKDGRHRSVIELLQVLCDRKRALPSECLLEAVSSFSRLGLIEGVKAVQMLCKETNVYEYTIQGGYNHYAAEATWTCGNIQEALSIFITVYEHNCNLRKKIRSMAKFLVKDVLSKQGEAALVLVTRFALTLASEHQDYHVLMVLWQCCFLSNWFADQRLAATLLNKHPELQSKVEEGALEMAFISLKRNHVEVVHRLLEVLLLHEMRTAYSQVLKALFDYKYDQRDVRACRDIVRCCMHLGVPLTPGQQHKFILLVVDTPHAPARKQPDETRQRPPEFTLKF
ncbi:uncharacterized protein LOC134541528 [Bacillus rossius redtenbacheri]|uniref:uncharacterized protein LOC134541528 n=1 Tax=Bacillus rossius redtenbacheri TaxID=93214 RepID=UPI002FDE208C